MLQQIDPRMGIQFPQQRVGSVPNGINMPGNLQKAAMANNRNVYVFSWFMAAEQAPNMRTRKLTKSM